MKRENYQIKTVGTRIKLWISDISGELLLSVGKERSWVLSCCPLSYDARSLETNVNRLEEVSSWITTRLDRALTYRTRTDIASLDGKLITKWKQKSRPREQFMNEETVEQMEREWKKNSCYRIDDQVSWKRKITGQCKPQERAQTTAASLGRDLSFIR